MAFGWQMTWQCNTHIVSTYCIPVGCKMLSDRSELTPGNCPWNVRENGVFVLVLFWFCFGHEVNAFTNRNTLSATPSICHQFPSDLFRLPSIRPPTDSFTEVSPINGKLSPKTSTIGVRRPQWNAWIPLKNSIWRHITSISIPRDPISDGTAKITKPKCDIWTCKGIFICMWTAPATSEKPKIERKDSGPLEFGHMANRRRIHRQHKRKQSKRICLTACWWS